MTRSVAKTPRVAEECDVNPHRHFPPHIEDWFEEDDHEKNWRFGSSARKRTETGWGLFIEPPVSSILQQVFDQCHASWRLRGRQP
ncbi:hypothetical protein TNCV_1554721 [Trichonephila clavipes]|nr:hypothetical protein TNCV_1554721 [Trichonephila clavipes]